MTLSCKGDHTTVLTMLGLSAFLNVINLGHSQEAMSS